MHRKRDCAWKKKPPNSIASRRVLCGAFFSTKKGVILVFYFSLLWIKMNLYALNKYSGKNVRVWARWGHEASPRRLLIAHLGLMWWKNSGDWHSKSEPLLYHYAIVLASPLHLYYALSHLLASLWLVETSTLQLSAIHKWSLEMLSTCWHNYFQSQISPFFIKLDEWHYWQKSISPHFYLHSMLEFSSVQSGNSSTKLWTQRIRTNKAWKLL